MNPTLVICSLGSSCCCICLLTFIGVYASVLNGKYSPVYQDVSCGDEVVSFQGLSMSGFSFAVKLGIALTCNNPNPYPIKIANPKQGKIYRATDMYELGTVVTEPGMLPEGSGQVELIGNVQLSGFSAIGLIADLLSGPLHVFLEVSFICEIYESLLVTRFKANPEFDQKCGVSLDFSGEVAGGVTCGDTFDDLIISEIGISLRPGSSSMGVDKEVIESATRDKNLYLGWSIGVSFFLIAFLIFCQCCMLYTARRTALQSYDTPVQTKVVAAQIGAGQP